MNDAGRRVKQNHFLPAPLFLQRTEKEFQPFSALTLP